MSYSDELFHVMQQGLERTIRDRQCPNEFQGTLAHIMLDGKEVINFSSNDYLGLSHHPLLKEAATAAIAKYGIGGGASRLMAGGTSLHQQLETEIAGIKQTEASLILNSGYTANTSIIPALARKGDLILSDELNHASIVDGCRLSRAHTVIYRHRDVDHLERLLTTESANRKIIVTDTVFSMDGDITPLPDIVAICRKHNVLLYIDDAHGTGVLGQGLGAMHHFSINPEPWVVQMGTFSKALGSFGAYIAASNEITRWLVNSGRGFIFSTALPAPIVAASLAALKLVVSDRNLNNTLWTNRKILVDGLQSLGFDIAPSETPIIPVQIGTIDETICASQFLFTEGIYAPAIRPPTVATPRLRITVSAAHNRQDIEHLCDAFAKLKKRRVSNTC